MTKKVTYSTTSRSRSKKILSVQTILLAFFSLVGTFQVVVFQFAKDLSSPSPHVIEERPPPALETLINGNENVNSLDQSNIKQEKKKKKKKKKEIVVPEKTGSPVATTLASKFPSLASCRKHHGAKKCDPSSSEIMVKNPWARDRFLCGQQLKAMSETKLLGSCEEPSRIFRLEPQIPPQNGSAIELDKPIEIVFGYHSRSKETSQYECDVPCAKIGKVNIFSLAQVNGTPWTFYHSMESTGYYGMLEIKDKSYKKNNFYATTSFRSEVPLPYYSEAEYHIQSPAVDYDTAIKGASFIASNCGSTNNREDVVTLLQDVIRVDSLGHCLNNAKPPNGLSMKQPKQDIQKAYLFHLAFENTNELDYVTEKLWGTLASGTLPVYMGAKNVKEHAPPHSIISVHDFKSTPELGRYLQKVASNKTLYESYHEWRKHPLAESFRRKYDMTQVHSICRICRWAYAKTTGLAWHHESQTVRELHMPRKVCLDKNNMIGYPFAESFGSMVASPLGNDCRGIGADSSQTSLELGSWTRTVHFHDGVIDVIIHADKRVGAYRLTTPIVGKKRRKTDKIEILEPQKHVRVQNAKTRMEIMTNGMITFATNKGVVDLALVPEEETRIRIIIEDVDTFHVGGDAVPYSFGTLMADDFSAPIQFITQNG